MMVSNSEPEKKMRAPRNLRKAFGGKVCIVTGGTSGIGAALCVRLGAAGATVIVAGRNMERGERVAELAAHAGGKATAEKVDVSDYDSVRSLLEGAASRFGRIDYLFNNAGISVLGETRDLGVDHWRPVIDVNLWGVIHGTLGAYEHMALRGCGHIVNVASAAGLFPIGFNAPYSAAKHAVVALSRAMRAEATAYGVKISVVCPGAVDTAIAGSMPTVNFPREIAEKFLSGGMSPDEAALRVLNGVARNRGLIIFPGDVRAIWRISRLFPRLYERLCLWHVAAVRKLREKARERGAA